MMAYSKDDETIRAMVEAVIAEDPQIAASMLAANYEPAALTDEIVERKEAIWEVTSEEVRTYDALEQTIDVETREIEAKYEIPEIDTRRIDRFFDRMETLLGALISISILLLIGIFGYRIWVGWNASAVLPGGLPGTWVMITLGGFLSLSAAAVSVLRRAHAGRLLAKRHEHKSLASDLGAKVRDESQIRGLTERREALAQKAERIEALLAARIKSEVVGAINARTAPSYAPRLVIREPHGFGEVFDDRLTIMTPARARLEFLIRNMPGGSIGIAGSRGAGKSTLLRNFCGPKRVVEQLNGKTVLGILVSAPVAYQARDFLLYLFTVTCQNVIEAEGGKFRPPELATDPVPGGEHEPWAAVGRLPMTLTRFGLVLAALALFLSLLMAIAPAPPAPAAPAAVADTKAGSPAGNAAADARNDQAAAPAAAANLPPQADAAPSFGSRWLAVVKFDPSLVFALAGTLVVLGLILAQLFRQSPRRILIGAMGGHRRFDREEADARAQEEAERIASSRPISDMENEAEAWLMTTKFQQSYTSGWSGSLKLPVGLEGGLSRAVNMAKNQLSVPELVYFFTRFLDKVSNKYQVVIGIDELDKLASEDLARQFINDIKSLFGLERCFYLVSVSENAMSSFERRGLPFRDEFDSAFDEVIYVDYLDFHLATKLLDRRVLGRPIPFFALSYCMSGGLPRDLIRIFRALIEVHGREPDRDGLSAIVAEIVTTDIRAKARATSVTARGFRLDLELDEFLGRLTHFDLDARTDRRLIVHALELLEWTRTIGKAGAGVGPPDPKAGATTTSPASNAGAAAGGGGEASLQPLRDLAEEFATYVLYVTTLRSYFGDGLARSRLVKAIDHGDIDRLARARRLIAVNPTLTRTEIALLRKILGIDRPRARRAASGTRKTTAPPQAKRATAKTAGKNKK